MIGIIVCTVIAAVFIALFVLMLKSDVRRLDKILERWSEDANSLNRKAEEIYSLYWEVKKSVEQHNLYTENRELREQNAFLKAKLEAYQEMNGVHVKVTTEEK